MGERRLNRRDAHRLALHYAINERDSYADAWGPGPERQKAEWLASEFRRVLREEFGERTVEDEFAAQPHEKINIFDLMGKPE